MKHLARSPRQVPERYLERIENREKGGGGKGLVYVCVHPISTPRSVLIFRQVAGGPREVGVRAEAGPGPCGPVVLSSVFPSARRPLPPLPLILPLHHTPPLRAFCTVHPPCRVLQGSTIHRTAKSTNDSPGRKKKKMPSMIWTSKIDNSYPLVIVTAPQFQKTRTSVQLRNNNHIISMISKNHELDGELIKPAQ